MPDLNAAIDGLTVCVIGPHRSGTSVVARLVNLLGYVFGPDERLMQADAWNERGYWENLDLTALNDEVLSHYGGAWDNPPPREALAGEPPQQLLTKAREILAAQFPLGPRGWKDPRTTLTVPFWRHVVPSMSFVICVRNPLDACASLVARDRLEPGAAQALCLRYMLDALENSAGSPRLFVSYEQALMNPVAQIERLGRFLGLPLEQTAAAIAEGTHFIDTALQHHKSSTDRFLSAPVDPRLEALYLAIAPLAGAVTEVSEPTLDSLARQMYASVVSEARKELDSTASVRSEYELQLANKDALLAEREARLGEQHGRLVEQEARLRDRDAWLSEKDARLQDRDDRVADKDAWVADLRTLAGRYLEEVLEARRVVSELSRELDSLRAAFARQTQEILEGHTVQTEAPVRLRPRQVRLRAFLSRAAEYRRLYGWRAFVVRVARPGRWMPMILGPRVRMVSKADSIAPNGPSGGLAGFLDRPASGAHLSRTVCFIEGWVLSQDKPVDRVEVHVDGEFVGLARLCMQRPDVAAVSDHPDAPISGFQFVLDLSSLQPRAAELAISVTAYDLVGVSLAFPTSHVTIQSPDFVQPQVAAPSVARQGPVSPKDRMHVACFTHDLGYGGAQLYLSELVRQVLKRRNLRFTVISATDGPLRRDLEALGIAVEILAVPLLIDRVRYQRMIADLVGWFGARRFDAVIGNTILVHAAITAAAQAGIPTIWAIHESFQVPIWCALNGAKTPEMVVSMTHSIQQALGSAQAVVFEAESTRQMYSRYADPVRMIHLTYGIDTDNIEQFLATFDKKATRRQLGFKPHERIITCIGTIHDRKQQTLLAQAFAAVSPRHPEARLVLIGDYPSEYSDGLHEYIRRTQIGDKITILPVRPEIYEWYGASDLFALVSDVESLPRTFLESMCFGVPVLGTNVFGVPELIDEGANGFLVAVNRLGDLIGKLDQVLSMDAADLVSVGDRARQLIRSKYDSAGYATAYLRLLDGLRAGLTTQEIVSAPG